MDTVSRISADEFRDRYASRPPIFDVRKKSEFDSESMWRERSTPLNRINDHLAEFPKDKPRSSRTAPAATAA